jgi:Amt family ammonium transporter
MSFVLVLSMLPGLAFFEAGLLRSKNSLSILIQVLAGISVNAALWDLIGYSLVYYGNFSRALMLGVSFSECKTYAPHVPDAAFAMFTMMFAVISPLLMTGAYAERVSFKASITFTVLWEVLVYYPVAHWIWGRGWLATHFGVRDFAGGITIHVTAGISALVCAIFVGRRKHFEEFEGEYPPSYLPLAAIGAGLLYCGWFGFNAGSALASGPVAASALLSTQIGGCFSALVWLIIDCWSSGHPNIVGLMNGTIAGLAGITPASGFIDNQGSILLGLLLGISSYMGCYILKHKLHIDDALEVTCVHGIPGLVGSLSIGFLATSKTGSGIPDGLFYGGSAHLLGGQVVGCIVAGIYSSLVTFIILFVINKVMGMRVNLEDEEMGLDMADHKEVAYHELMIDMVHDHIVEKLPKHFRDDFVQFYVLVLVIVL